MMTLIIQCTPCYGKEKNHSYRVILFCLAIFLTFIFIVICRFKFATTVELQDAYGRLWIATIYLNVGFFFYVSHTPDKYLTRLFGKTKQSRWIREKIQLWLPAHALWHVAVAMAGY